MNDENENIEKKKSLPSLVPTDLLVEQPPETEIINHDLDPTNPNDLLKLEEEARKVRDEFIAPEHKETEKKIMEEFSEIIETEDELLRAFPEDRMNLNVIWDNKLYKFKIKPIQPGDNFKALNLDADVLSDIDMQTREAIGKKSQGKVLTRKEEQLLKKLDSSNVQEMANASLIMAHDMLCQYITPPDFNGDFERRRNWWMNAPFSFKMFVMSEATKRLGLDSQSSFKLFQVSR